MSSARCALVTVFNHKYEKNIPRLEDIYRHSFEHRSYLVPFATLNQPNVLNVYASGLSFGHHIAQAADRYIRDDVDYYVFAGDDLIINPTLNGRALVDMLGIDDQTGFLKSIALADDLRYAFMWSGHAAFSLRSPGFDWRNELPPVDVAEQRLSRLGLVPSNPKPRGVQDLAWTLRFFWRWRYCFLMNLLMTGQRSAYPLVTGYSDFLVVPRGAIRDFARYCGVLAATNMQAEVVVPTAMLLACANLKTELPPGQHFLDGTPNMPKLAPADARLRSDHAVSVRAKGLEIWGRDIATFEAEHACELQRVLDHFPPERVYVHPVKLSRWH